MVQTNQMKFSGVAAKRSSDWEMKEKGKKIGSAKRRSTPSNGMSLVKSDRSESGLWVCRDCD
jgi:hypothetical protein